MDFYKSSQIRQEDYLASLLLLSMKTDYPRCLLSVNCPGQFCKWFDRLSSPFTSSDTLKTLPPVFTLSLVYSTDHMPKDRLRPLFYVLLLRFLYRVVARVAAEPGNAEARRHF